MPANNSSTRSKSSNISQDILWKNQGRSNKILKPSVTQAADNFILQIELNDASISKIERAQANLFGILGIREGSIDHANARQALGLNTNTKGYKDEQPETSERTDFRLDNLKKLTQAMLGNNLVVNADELNNITLPRENREEGQKYIHLIQDSAYRNRLYIEKAQKTLEVEQLSRKLNIRFGISTSLGILACLLGIVMLSGYFNAILAGVAGALILGAIVSAWKIPTYHSAWKTADKDLADHVQSIASHEESIVQQTEELGLRLPVSIARSQTLAKTSSKPVIPQTITGNSNSATASQSSHSSGSDKPVSNVAQRAALLGSSSKAPHSGSYGYTIPGVASSTLDKTASNKILDDDDKLFEL